MTGSVKLSGPLVWLACESTGAMAHKDAVAAARGHVSSLWLEAKDGYFAAYTMPGEKRNPFDVTSKAPAVGPRDGVVQARPPACTVSELRPGTVRVRFTSRFYRFYEKEAGWSPPARDGLLAEIEAGLTTGAWTAKDSNADTTILDPETPPRRPLPQALPKRTRWAAPMPPCAKGTRWNGIDCVGQSRKR